jgi:hypothetical protein
MPPFVLIISARTSRLCFLAGLLAPNDIAFEFVFRPEPIVSSYLILNLIGKNHENTLLRSKLEVQQTVALN